MKRSLAIGMAVILAAATPAAARDALGVFGKWGAFRDVEKGRCFAIGRPKHLAPAGGGRVPGGGHAPGGCAPGEPLCERTPLGRGGPVHGAPAAPPAPEGHGR